VQALLVVVIVIVALVDTLGATLVVVALLRAPGALAVLEADSLVCDG